jgi:ABC-type multidrug transport system fused ATPase/permease subunit
MGKRETEFKWRILLRYVPFMKPHLLLVAGSGIASVFLTLLHLSEAYFIIQITNIALQLENGDLVSTVVFMAIIMICSPLLTYLSKYSSYKFGAKTIRDFRKAMIEKIIVLKKSYISDQNSGDILSKLSSDIAHLQNFMGSDTTFILLQSLYFIGASIVMVAISWKLYLLTLCLSPVAIYFLKKQSEPLDQYTYESQQRLGKSQSFVNDTISGISIVKSFGAQHSRLGTYKTMVEDIKNLNRKKIRISSRMLPLNIILRVIPKIIAVIFGGVLSLNNEINPGN